MNQNKVLSDILKSSDRAVSPVIATILVVAITVILAAVIGATAFGFTDTFTDSPPQANLQAEEETVTINQDVSPSPGYDKDFRAVTITHTSGDNIDKDKIRVTVNGKEAYATPRPPQDFYDITTEDRNDPTHPWDTVGGDSISSGDSTTIVLRTDVLIDNGFQPGDNAIVFATGGNNLVQYGTELLTEDDDAQLSSGDTVRMIWESGDQSVPLLEYEVS